MESELISVIIPVYNTERYLAACLDSVLSQSYRTIEVILIDDGSTDYSLRIAEGYAEKDDRVRVYSFENEGLAETRNRGLSVATGEFVTFVDSDDMLMPDALEIMMGVIKKEEADIVEGGFIRGKIFKNFNKKIKISTKIFNHIEAIADVLYQNTLLPSAWGKLYKRELFYNLLYEKGILYEDLNIVYLLLERSKKTVWIDYPVYFYRETEGSILNTWKPQRLDVLKVTENIENYISLKYPQLLPAAKDRRLSANFNMFSLCSIHGDEINANECWELIRKYRTDSLLDKNVRLKNKLGVALSYSGKTIFKKISRLVYKNKT